MENIKLTKNLKLKIKNSQLTKAAGLDKLKKKLAQAGSEPKESSEKSKISKITRSSKKVKEDSSPLVQEASLSQDVAPKKRIRAKNKSSFEEKIEQIDSSLESENSTFKNLSIEDEVTPPILEPKYEETTNSIAPEITAELPEAFLNNDDDTQETTSFIDSESSFSNQLVESEPSEEEIILSSSKNLNLEPESVAHNTKTTDEPVLPPQPIKKKVGIKSQFGPTGKHINHILPPQQKRTSDTISTRSTPPTTNKPDSIPRKENTSSTPTSERKFSNNVARKGVVDFKDKVKRSNDVKAFTGRDRYGLTDNNEEERWRKKRPSKIQKVVEEYQTIRPTHIKVAIPITVKDLAAEMKLKASELIQKLFIHGMTYVVNDLLDNETTVQFIGLEFGCTVEIDNSEQEKICIISNTVKEEIEATDPSKLISRDPIIAFMGHVDHGKTSLIDALRESNIASGEAGAITQHMGAFRCSTSVGNLTILDTPGHEAFSAMRARGAEVCDIVVLVVAGDEGIKEQTVEAIQHALNANITIVVAINKCDKPGFNAENIYRQLSEHNLLPESWGGSIVTVNTSAKTKEGLSDLLEMLALQAEVLELRADPTERARGIVIESELHKGLGFVATVLVQNGTLKLGDALVFNDCYGKVKTMHNEHHQLIKEAAPSIPVLITGLSNIPQSGDPFVVVKNDKYAKEIIEARLAGKQRYALQQKKTLSLEKVLQNKKILKIVLKADVQGSIEALTASMLKIQSEKVVIEIVSSGVGEISESDIRLAAASKSVIIGFHTNTESHAEPLIKELGVKVKLFDIIYHAIDEIKVMMKDLLDPIAEEKDIGTAEIKEVFKSSHLGLIYGCQVMDGIIMRNHKIRLKRDGEDIWKGSISSLKRIKEDVKEVKKGLECGILLDGFNQGKIGDIIHCFEIIYHPQEL